MISQFKKGISIVKAARLSTKFSLLYRGTAASHQYNNLSARSFATEPIYLNEKEVIAIKQENIDIDIDTDTGIDNILEKKTKSENDVQDGRLNLSDNINKIFNIRGSDELLHLFEEEIALRPNLEIEELYAILVCLSADFDQNIKNDHRFKNLIEKLFSKIESIPPEYISRLVTAIINLTIELETIKMKALIKLIYNNSDIFKLDEIQSIIFFFSNILVVQDKQNHDMIISILKKFTEIIIPNMNIFSGIDCLNILVTYSMFPFEKVTTLLVTALKDNLVTIANENDLRIATHIILVLDKLNIQDEEIYQHFFRYLIQGNIQNMDVKNAYHLLILFSDKTRNCKDVMGLILKVIVSNLDNISKFHYVKIWELIPKIKDSSKSSDYDDAIQILKEFLFSNNVWDLVDLEFSELNIIIRNTAFFGQNDDDFLEQLIDFIEPYLTMVNNYDLLYLTDTVCHQTQEFSELFFIKIKNECHKRINQFNDEEIKSLQHIFTGLNENFPGSPLEDL